MKRKVNIGLIGAGTVGTGVIKLLERNSSGIEQRVGTGVVIRKICDRDALRLRRIRKMKIRGVSFTGDAMDVISDKDIDIIVELIGDVPRAKEVILSAIRKGKHVVTANKAVLAKHWTEIFSEADRQNVLVYFEASVGGGIPIVRALNEGLSANRIRSILGILNGTTNYILTRMTDDSMDFKEALAIAKQKGFAEKNPSLDIDGLDAAYKILILSSLAFGARIKLSDIYCEGIGHVVQKDIRYARDEFGYILKLLAILKQKGDKIELRVHPTLLPQEHMLSSVEDEYNAIYVDGDAAGETMFYGRGAGEMPAASAVVSDVICLARDVYNNIAGCVPHVLCNPKKKLEIIDIKDIETKYYIRFTTLDRPGVLSKISGILGSFDVSIGSVYQMGHGKKMQDVPIVMVTHRAKEGNVRKALSRIDRLSVVRKKSVLIRIED